MNHERRLVKAGLYGFIVGLFLAILFCPDTLTTRAGPQGYVTEVMPPRQYVLIVLRFAIKVALGSLAAVWVYERFWRPVPGRTEPSFWAGFFKAFFLVLGLIVLFSLISSAIR